MSSDTDDLELARTAYEVQVATVLSEFGHSEGFDQPVALAELSKARSDGNLYLFLGAGVSYGYKVPTWVGLVDRVVEEILLDANRRDIRDILFDGTFSPIVKVRVAESIIGSKFVFRSHLQRLLYKGIDLSLSNPTMDAVVRIILGLDGGSVVKNVVTYNFDDILEEKLRNEIVRKSLDLRVVSVCNEDDHGNAQAANCVRIYHPHGFLPRKIENDDDILRPIVFAEDDFHDQFFDLDYWANRQQVQCLKSGNCLFIGLSMTDGNVRRLLDQTRGRSRDVAPRHLALFVTLRPDPISDLKRRVRQLEFLSLGVRPVWAANFGEMTAILEALAR